MTLLLAFKSTKQKQINDKHNIKLFLKIKKIENDDKSLLIKVIRRGITPLRLIHTARCA